MEKSDKKISKFISLILRHKPEVIGIKLDNNGWANVNELIEGIKKSGREIDINSLNRIVLENDKQRFTFNDDKSKIRANQGHSLNIDLELKEIKAPDVLYHGTATRFLDSILKSGIQSNGRQYVHLSEDFNTAVKVGSRHGNPVVLVIDTKEMVQNNVKFFLSKNNVWLTKFVDAKYISRIERV